jgi:DNA-binding transcriptional LysR family regulator
MAHAVIATEPLVLALPEQHPLAQAVAPPLADVLVQPLVMFPRRILPSVYDAVFGLYHAAGRSPQIAQEAIQMQTIVNLVAAGLGLAWVPQSVTQFQRAGVVYRSPALPRARRGAVGARSVPSCETSLAWAEGNRNAALARFVEFVAADARL